MNKKMKEKKYTKTKVIVTDTIRKTLRKGNVVELSHGYANYLINNKKAIHYNQFMEHVYLANTVSKIDTNEYSNLNVHIDGMYLHFARVSNKSGTLYGKITAQEVFNEIYNKLKQKNIHGDLLKMFTSLNINSIISLPTIKSSNTRYAVALIGVLNEVTINICVGSNLEECAEIEKLHIKENK